MKKIFWIFYGTLVIVLVGLSGVGLKYVKDSIILYENSLPTGIVESAVVELYDEINSMTALSATPSMLHFPDSLTQGNEYSDSVKIREDYINDIKGKELNYKFVKEDYSTGNKEYLISADDKNVAKMVLSIVSEERKLGFLPIVDMEVKEILPIMNIDAYDYDFKVQSSHQIFINDKPVTEQYLISSNEIPEYKYLYEYVYMPRINEYRVENIYGQPDIKILDENGNELEYEDNGGYVDTSEYLTEKSDTVPDDISKEIDVLLSAKTWSLFTTRDLTGPQYGLEQVRQYFIRDSYYWNKLEEYANGIDITLVSDHNPATTYFTGEQVRDFIRYNDECFSARVIFGKHMYLKSGKLQDDYTDSTFYFVKDDEGKWKIADIQAYTN